MFFAFVPTAWGWVALAFSQAGVRALTLPFPTREEAQIALAGKALQAEARGTTAPSLLRQDLGRYFAGEKVDLSFHLLDEKGLSPFQRYVFQKVREIPYGEVRCYEEIAQGLGKPGAARAVGQVLKRNPFLLLVPCHRVIAKNGSWGGFQAGLAWKQRLLLLEKASLGRFTLKPTC